MDVTIVIKQVSLVFSYLAVESLNLGSVGLPVIMKPR